jgi:hypothetical protein
MDVRPTPKIAGVEGNDRKRGEGLRGKKAHEK